MENKTHYRKVFKSDHLGVVDLEEYLEEGKNLIFTIARVEQRQNERVAGRKINCNVAFFNEPIKPMVLNATNSKIIRGFKNSPFVEDWCNTIVELYIDSSVKMKGETVGGVRIKSRQPQLQKQTLNESHPDWLKGAQKASEGMTIQQMRQFYNITEEDYKKLCDMK